MGDAYHKLRGSVRASPLVHTDDTGWRVDGGPAFLMAFETDEATVYQVRTRHRNEEVREVVPSDYGGVMVTDRGRSYDAKALSGVKQQKCLAHVLRSISEVVQTKRGRGRSFGNRLSRLLREAMELRQAYHRGEAADFAAEAERLRREATYHLRDRPMSEADQTGRVQNVLRSASVRRWAFLSLLSWMIQAFGRTQQPVLTECAPRRRQSPSRKATPDKLDENNGGQMERPT